MGRGTSYTYDVEGNLTFITDASGRTEVMTYDVAGRITSYTSNGGNKISYDYDKLDNLVEKSYENAKCRESAEPVAYAYDATGQRVAMYDSTGDTEYTYDGANNLFSIIYSDRTKVSYGYGGDNRIVNLFWGTDDDLHLEVYVSLGQIITDEKDDKGD